MNTKSIASGGVCVVIGGLFALSAMTSLKIGTATNMGPGYFPLALAIILIAVGIYMIVRAVGEEPDGFWLGLSGVPWRGLLLICLAPIVFGFTIRGLGLGPSMFLSSMISAFASRAQTLKTALLVSFALTLFCTVIFALILKLPIPVVGPWLDV